MKRYIGAAEFHILNIKLCEKLEKEIGTRSFEKKTVVYGINRGGLTTGVYVSHYFGIELRILDISCYDYEDKRGGIKVRSPLPDVTQLYGVDHVIIVDDLVDSGTTINFVKEHFNYLNKQTGFIIDTAAVFYAKDCETTVDVVAETLESDSWIVFPYEDN